MASYLLPLLALASATYTSVSAAPTAGQVYTISPASHPDLCVVPNGDWNGARLIITDCDNSDSIAWSFDGQSLKNSATNRCVDVLDGGHWNGNGLQAWDCFDHNTNQRFGSSGGAIQWTGTGMCLDLTDGRADDGTTLQCFDGNTNQQWTFDEVEEVDDCEDVPATTVSAAPTTVSSAAPTASPSQGSNDDGEDCDDDEDNEDGDDEECDAEDTSSVAPSASATAAPSASSTIGGGLWVGQSSLSATASASASDSWNDGSSSIAPSASASDSWNDNSSSASASASATSSATTPVQTSNNNADFSGYQQTSGTKIVDASGNTVQWKGTNLGGWLVWEDWMCGITDNSGTHDRFPQSTLERRFGEDQTRALMKTWQDNWLIESDFDNLAAMGFNVLRLPFSYRNFVRSDGSYITDASGSLDYSRLEWAIAQAKKRGMYVIPTYHIWEGQEERYSTISEDSWEGKQQRDRCGELWTMIAQHFAGETAIAAFDAINEPTGSANNNLQRDLYHAIRKGDSKRIIVMESISAAPDSDWTNVVYSMHEYLMMGEDDFGYNKYMFEQGPRKETNAYTSVGVPTYIGEFMAGGETLDYMLDQMNNMGVGWSGWSYKSVDRDRWALYNFGGNMRVDVSADSYDQINSVWSNMGGISKSRVGDAYARAAGGSAPSRRSLPSDQVNEVAARFAIPPSEAAATFNNDSDSETERVTLPGQLAAIASSSSPALKRSTPHAGRSRRGVVGLLHGNW